MPWKPLPRIAFAVCIYPFNPSRSDDLPLQIGDELYIIEQGGKHGEWYRGYLVAPPSLLAGLTSSKGQALEARVFSGIFPTACVEIRELLGEVTKYVRDDGVPPSSDSATLSGPWPTPPRGVPSKAQQDASSITQLASALFGASEEPSTNRVAEDVVQLPPGQKPPAPVPMLKIGDETATAKQEPLVDEIASCLREWHSTNLHQLLLGRKYERLQDMSELVNHLDSARRQLIHQILTTRELDDVRDDAIWDLVTGNKILSGEVIVRSTEKKGKILTAEDSVVEISKLQSIMSLMNERSKTQPEPRSLHHLLFKLKSFANDNMKTTTFAVAVYSVQPNSEPAIISEVFSIDASAQDSATGDLDKEEYRTLFVDLNLAHLKATSQNDHQIYLVVKIITNESISNLPKSSKTQISNGDIPSPFASTAPASNKSRMSLMLPRGRKDGPQTRPPTGNSAATRRPDARDDKRPRTPGGYIKKITGVGTVNITNLFESQIETEQPVTIWSTASSFDAVKNQNRDWDPILPLILPNPAKLYTHSSSVRGVVMNLRCFSHPNSEKLIETTPTVLQNIRPTQNIGFAEAPTRPRSDIYLTLCQPYLPQNALLSHPKSGSVLLPPDSAVGNIQLTMEVRKANGDRISNCIFPSSNSSGHTAWRTTAIERQHSWNQTIKLAISPDDVPGCHIIMSIADATVNFPFALAWMPLWFDDAFVRDGDHNLILYRYDEHTSELIAGKRAYLALPWNSKTKEETVSGPVAHLRLRTYLCSTKYSQDPTLLGILRWRDQRSHELRALLQRFSLIPDMEIVKLLNDVFQALFEILVKFSNNQDFEDLAFNALVLVLGVAHDRRFNLQPMVDNYAQKMFNYPLAFSCLTRSLCRLLADAKNSQSSRKLRATFKVGSDVFKFIVKSRKQQVLKDQGTNLQNHNSTFAKDLEVIFNAIGDMMRDPSPEMIGTKTLLVQNFHRWLPELTSVLSPEEISNISTSFIDCCSDVQGKLLLYRLVLIYNVTSSGLLPAPRVDNIWHANVFRWLEPYWTKPDVITQPWREQIRLCSSIISAEFIRTGTGSLHWMSKLIQTYHLIQDNPRSPTQSFSPLFPSSYPLPSRALTFDLTYDESLIEISALIVQMSTDALKTPALPNDELFDLLTNALKVCRSVLDCQAFPSEWLTLHIYYHDATLRILRAIHFILITRFLPKPDQADDFPTDVWNEFFSTLLQLVASDALALETFPEQKRRAVWKIAGDVREAGAKLLEQAWDDIGWETSTDDKELFGLDKMGGYQVQYVPKLVAPIVRLCLSVHEGLRSAAINILRVMIMSEWALSQDLSVIQTEIINCLDQLFKKDPPTDGMLHKIFVEEMLECFETLDQSKNMALLSAVKDLFDVVTELLSLLVAVHGNTVTGEAFQIMDTLRLMEFLRDIQKELIYVGYVHKLARSQHEANNPTEAGLALKMHAELYEWDYSTTLDALEDPFFPAQSSFERKEQLYFQMIQNFEEGQAWQQALNAYEELANQYQHNIFDFAKLARAQRAMATIYEKIGRVDKQTSRYFRVIFRGLGFSPTLRDRQFIFEGTPADRMPGFLDKLMRQYPSAQIVTSAAVDDLEGQYLSVYPVGAVRNLIHPVNRRVKVSQGVRDHFILSQSNQFAMSTRRQASVGTLKDQFQEKTIYTTAETFPTILRRSEIIKTETLQLSAVQVGLERTLRKTQELSVQENQVQENDESSFEELTNLLRVLVRPNSSGSVADQWKLLTQDEADDGFGKQPSSKANLTTTSALEEALRVALLDHASTIRRCLSKYTKTTLQARRAELTTYFEETFGPVIEVLNALSSQPTADLTNPQWLWNLSEPNPNPENLPPADQRQEPALESDTRAGAAESANKNDANADRRNAPQPSRTTNGIKSPTNSANPLLLSSRTSVSNDQGASATFGDAGDQNASTVTESSGLENKQGSTSSARQSRIGSVTKRLSALSIGKKRSGVNMRSTTIDSVAE